MFSSDNNFTTEKSMQTKIRASTITDTKVSYL